MQNNARTPKQIGDILRRIRRRNHLTQGVLGDKSGLWQETISKVESGSNGTKIETICAILAALDLELLIVPRKKSSTLDIEENF